MSAVVKTITPFIDKECLLKALDVLNVKNQIKGQEIITERIDYQGKQKFIQQGKQFKFQYDSYQAVKKNYKQFKTISSFLQAVEIEYNKYYQEKLAEIERKKQQALEGAERKRLEAEAKRLKEERKAFVENQKKSIIEKAKAKGYSIKEKRVGKKIKLVLVRHTY